jgi:hypothetical protein
MRDYKVGEKFRVDGVLYKVVKIEDGRQKMLEVKRNFNFMGVNEDILFSNIEVNKTYTFKCWGWDVESFWIFSLYWYPNIIAIQEII